jgi:hypothetical protein
MATLRRARDGLLILGGGLAGGYVARLAGTGSTVVSLENRERVWALGNGAQVPNLASGTTRGSRPSSACTHADSSAGS